MKNKEDKRLWLTVSLSKEEKEMAKTLREKYSINISSFFREKLKELFNSLQSKK